jgi:hypothetical protein
MDGWGGAQGGGATPLSQEFFNLKANLKYIPIIKMMFDVTSIISNFDNVEN